MGESVILSDADSERSKAEGEPKDLRLSFSTSQSVPCLDSQTWQTNEPALPQSCVILSGARLGPHAVG